GWAWYSGKKVAMTDMPQMVALYNGMGGGAAAAIAATELFSGNAQAHGVVVSVLAVRGGLSGAGAPSGPRIARAKRVRRSHGAVAAVAATALCSGNAQAHGVVVSVLAVLGGLIGAVALSGSLSAWAKLDGRMNGVIRLPAQQLINAVLFLGSLALGAYIVVTG